MNDPPQPHPATENGASARPGLMERLRALFGLGAPSIRDDFEDALAEDGTQGDFSPQERAMLKNVLGLHELRVVDVMVPRADIVAIALDMPLADVLKTFRTAGHSRLPVHGETLDDPRGMIHIRDFVDWIAEATYDSRLTGGVAPFFAQNLQSAINARSSGKSLLRPVLYVPPSMPALDLLVRMQTTRTHMALVIDEYGGTDGLASIEDIVEMIVGDIEDEHDHEEGPRIEAAAEGHFIADGRADLEEVSQAIGADLSKLTESDDIDTLGGFVTTLAGHVPVRGEIVADGNLEFEVLDADPRRVKRIRIHVGALSAGTGSADGLDAGAMPEAAVRR